MILKTAGFSGILTRRTLECLLAVLSLCAFASCGGGADTNEREIAEKVNSLLSKMTVEEKVGQLVLLTSDWDVTGPTMKADYLDDIRSGRCGNVFNAHTAEYVRSIQEIAVNETRLGIPVLFGYDVIHGYKTEFPISLGEAASWNLGLIREAASVAAAESAAAGLKWTFAPMCDVCVDPRWGRVSEGAGEDPFLASEISAARVRGFQGRSLDDTLSVLACVKHFAAYGAAQAGRDYHTVDMSERRLREMYLPPYKAAIDAGALSVMNSFNELDGVPATANTHLLKDILRDEWGFKGFVVTDYTSINEMVPHGYARDEKHAGELAMHAGVDMDLQGAVYYSHLKSLVEEGRVSMDELDDAVRRVLTLKYKLGLFDDPFRYCSAEREKAVVYSEANLDAALRMACESFVLLKNDNAALPLEKGCKVAVIGSLAASADDLLGSWRAASEAGRTQSLLDALREYNGNENIVYAPGYDYFKSDSEALFPEALSAARKADRIVLVLGEKCSWTGEAKSRADIRLPKVQTRLLEAVRRLGKPVSVVLMSGRPVEITRESAIADAILECWYPGSMGGKAIAMTLFGENNPSGKLPATFPRSVGQIPIYYYMKNTGRPSTVPDLEEKNIYAPAPEEYKSMYIDCPNKPLYAFGHGLSYTGFGYSPVSLSSDRMTADGCLKASVTVKNVGKAAGCEVVQLYVRDLVGSVTRPVKELKAFRKISLAPGESTDVEFEITPEMLSFWRADMTFGPEPGEFRLFVGTSSDDTVEAEFELI